MSELAGTGRVSGFVHVVIEDRVAATKQVVARSEAWIDEQGQPLTDPARIAGYRARCDCAECREERTQ